MIRDQGRSSEKNMHGLQKVYVYMFQNKMKLQKREKFLLKGMGNAMKTVIFQLGQEEVE